MTDFEENEGINGQDILILDKTNKTNRRGRAVAALLFRRSVTEAAKDLGVSAKTLSRWLADSSFQADLRAAEAEAVTFASRRLVSLAAGAIDTLDYLRVNATSDSVKRQAACDLLSYLIRLKELNDFESRLLRLEQQMGGTA